MRRPERQAAVYPPADLGPDCRDARRNAFINAVEEMLPQESFVELWARAAERDPSVFVDADGSEA